MQTAKLKTIDDLCGGKSGSFESFLKQKRKYLKKREQDRLARIRSGRAARSMAWAA